MTAFALLRTSAGCRKRRGLGQRVIPPPATYMLRMDPTARQQAIMIACVITFVIMTLSIVHFVIPHMVRILR